MISYATPDLTQHPPRSPRVQLGGYIVLPRIIDKARAHAAGKTGEFKYNNPLDKRLFTFAGIDADAFLAAAKSGLSDTEMLAWFNQNSANKRTDFEIATWSNWLLNLPPGDAVRHQMAADLIKEKAPGREDIRTLFDRLDLDDYLTFGGRP
ncbi:DUF5069 domain-containing protein [Nibricoccus aquaticus]|uniref:DUF5069 domain-containing protein n=1 Tax=Nibricoccus aquaticus TaxID=2576891 RepID=A0A290Q372_9BACT|nr:DUF5069 domain-containing protein [Nibricoccus aquaticus]ATC62747.1 DUF5069 domain-containing protein [Nibricoccus aquaticus]